MNSKIELFVKRLEEERAFIESVICEISKENDDKFLIEQERNIMYYKLNEENITGSFTFENIRHIYFDYCKFQNNRDISPELYRGKIKDAIYKMIEEDLEKKYF